MYAIANNCVSLSICLPLVRVYLLSNKTNLFLIITPSHSPLFFSSPSSPPTSAFPTHLLYFLFSSLISSSVHFSIFFSSLSFFMTFSLSPLHFSCHSHHLPLLCSIRRPQLCSGREKRCETPTSPSI